MARCPNKNTAEYKALQEVYKSEIATNNIINSWQDANNTDIFPTVVEAQQFAKYNKVVFALKQKSFAESLLNNLREKKLIHTEFGLNLINASNPNVFYTERVADPLVVEDNKRKIEKYLEANNIPLDAVSILKTNKTYKVTVDQNVFTSKDILESSRSWDTPRALAVVMHLRRMFPQIQVKMLSVADAQARYNSIPQWQKSKVNFKDVNSFYVDNVAYLVKGRVTDETAIEEILHPFTDAIKMDNPKLFNGLLAEAKINFPEMVQSITEAYNGNRNFSQLERDLEIVTQALSRHFNNEYEKAPTKRFLDRIQEALDWFMEVINNLKEYMTGKPISVKDINNKATFSDIAKLLNTEDISFKLESKANAKVRYSLSPEKQKIVDKALDKSNAIQTEIIKRLFHIAINSKEEIDSLSVNLSDTASANTIVVLNKEDHTYVDITNREIYKSVTTAIKGQLANEEDVQLNLTIDNDVDALLDAVISKQSFDDVFPQMKVFDKDIAERMFDTLEEQIFQLIPQGAVGISQVVVFDEATKLASTADLVVIDKNGKIRIVDLKTSKNSIYDRTFVDAVKNKIPGRTQGTKYELKEYELKEDVPALDAKGNPILNSDGSPKIYLGSDLKKIHGVNKLSTEGQHNLQVNLHRRMFENMGYTVYEGDGGAKTFHIQVDITGKGKEQVFNNKFRLDGIVEHSLNKFSLYGIVEHPPSQNLLYVDMIVPPIINNTKKESLDRAIGNAEDAIYRGDQDVDAMEKIAATIEAQEKIAATIEAQEKIAATIEAQQYPEYNIIFNALENYSVALVEQNEALDKLKSNVFRDKTKQQTRDDIASTLAYIASNINTGPIARSRTYTNLLRASLNEMQKFTAYVEDPTNINKPEYITYALNFNRFLSTFEALYSIKDSKELNATQRTLVLQMQLEQNKLLGTNGKEGLINDAILDYVKEVIRTRSTNDWGGKGSGFTEDMLDDLLVIAPDIAMDALNVQDMATQKDTILAVMDKIYKSQKQKLLDKIEEREFSIRNAGNQLLKLSANKDLQSLYDFMLEYDKDGQFTGFYIRKIGQQYYSMQESLRKELYGIDNNPFEYRDVSNLDKAKPEDIKYNIELAKKKAAFNKFFEAESVDADGRLIDGEYHRYTDEFKKARNKYEYWVPSNNKQYGTWYRKPRISDRDYAIYEAKYYDFSTYTSPIKVNGEPTGAVEKEKRGRFPKVQYRVAREISGSGQDMRSEKYKALMDPNKTDALSIAQRNFYNMFIKYYEGELLNKLPQHIKDQMSGRVPIVKNNILDTLKNQPNIIAKMYASTVRSIKNFTQETATQKNVLLDEQGNFVNSLPIWYTGKVRVDEDLANVETEITALKDKKKKGLINPEAYKKKLALLNGTAAQLRAQPSLGELNKDMTSALLKFSAMAEHYEVMGEIEDTLTAMVKVIENRTYTPADPAIITGTKVDSKFKKAGTIKGSDSNALRRAKKYMSMIYYDNELATKGMIDKISDELIGVSSLAYVAFNPFGNLNNYVMGRINNNIELLGARYFSKKNGARAAKEYNIQAISGLLTRTSAGVVDLADIATLGKTGLKKSDYDADKPNNKYEALVDMFRMMDEASDIRESGRDNDGKTIWSRFKEWGYVMQDAAEYNVQSKVGIAMLMDITIKNSSTGETLSLYDAFQYNAQTHKNELIPGYDTIVNKNGSEQPYTDQFRYDLTNQIKSVIKQIHGNYAKDDRMVIQGHTLGNLATQFHKWVAPAIRSRFRREYFDQNLGWIEGRYRSFFKFLNHAKGEIVRGNFSINPTKYHESFKEAYGFTGEGGNLDQRAEDKLSGFYRTTAELGIMMSVLVLNSLLSGILSADDDDEELTKRLKNLVRLQGDRTYKEMVLFTPLPEGLKQQYALFKSPIATTRTLGELGEALSLTYMTPLAYLYKGKDAFYADKDYVYQTKPNKGKLKVYKNWADVVPILYSIQKWDNMIKAQDFYIK